MRNIKNFDWDSAREDLLNTIGKDNSEFGNYIYECCQEYLNKCIGQVEERSDFVPDDDGEMWYDEVRAEAMVKIYSLISNFVKKEL